MSMTPGYRDAPYRSAINRVAVMVLTLAVCLSSFHVLRVASQNLSYSDILFALAAIMFIAIGRINLSPFRELSPFWFGGLALFISGLFFSSLMHNALDRWVIVASQYLFSYMLLPIVIMGQDRQRIISLIKVFIVSVTLIEVVGVITVYSLSFTDANALWGPEFMAGNGRLGSFAGESNWNGLLIASTLPILAYAIRTHLFPLIVSVPSMIILLWALTLSASFTGFTSALCAMTIFLVVSRTRPSPRIVAVVVMVVTALYLGGYQMPEVFQKRVAGAYETGQLDEAGTFTDRARLMADAWKMADDTTFTGVGVSRFREIHPSGQPVHNMYLLVWNEGGLPALIGWIMMVLILIVLPLPVLRRHPAEAAVCCGVIFVFLAYTMASPHMFGRFWMVPLMLPLGLILTRPSVSATQPVEDADDSATRPIVP
ncbi:O-antigen ligase family protein [Rhizorhapis sp. SPR117]|uniref:O-antigen ligase family protein n=1 Tax=Rhizorhapis sp. SPR117 TaxID=2912611 RepID=UPI001F44DA19|nr:O-antigen ligase family protein [Rhizorhapis sp. SPR117]